MAAGRPRARKATRHISVHPRVALPHLLRLALHHLDLDERPLTDAGAVFRGLPPLAAAFHQFRPERERAALGRFDGMDGTSVTVEEAAAGVAGHTQAHAGTRAV